MPTESRWALPTLQLLNLFFKTYSNRIPYEIFSRKTNGVVDGEMGDRMRPQGGGFTISLHEIPGVKSRQP
jgi:hypothetical protein